MRRDGGKLGGVRKKYEYNIYDSYRTKTEVKTTLDGSTSSPVTPHSM